MNCKQVRELLPLYADGDLEAPLSEQVAQHLEGCEACRQRLAVDRELTARLASMPSPAGATEVARSVRGRVMADIEKKRRWWPLWRAAERLGNATVILAMCAVTGLLVLGLAISWRPLIQRGTEGTPTGPFSEAPGWTVVSDETIASPYYWVIDGERVDRTPQLSPDGTKAAYLPTIDGQATDLDRLVVRDLRTGEERDLTPEEGYSYTSVRWSPDGRSLAFIKYRSQQDQATPTEVWRVDADGVNLKLLYRLDGEAPGLRGPSLGIVRWSADGRKVLVTPTIWSGGGPDRWVYADGSGSEDVVPPAAADFGAREGEPSGGVVFSPTDDYALHAVNTDSLLTPPANAPAGGQSLMLYDLESRQSRVLGSFDGTVYVADGSISPDGQWIALTVIKRGEDGTVQENQLWVVRPDGSGLRRVTNEDGEPILAMGEGPLWAAGGRCYFNQPRAVSAIWIQAVDAATGQARLIPHKYPATSLASVSRDGRKLLVVRGEWEKAELDLLELSPASAEGELPTGMALYHQGQIDELTTDLSAYGPVATYAWQALQGVEGDIQAALLNPWDEAERVKREGVALELTYADPGIQVGSFKNITSVLIPLDGGADIFLGGERYEHLVPTQSDGAISQLRQVFAVALAPTGEPPAPPTVAAEAPTFGEARDLFAPPPSTGWYRISPDGKWVLYPVQAGETGVGPILPHLEADSTEPGGPMQMVALFGADFPGGVSDALGVWFPDSRHVLATANDGQGQVLVVLDREQSAPRTLVRAPEGSQGLGEAAVSPDGQRIAYLVYYYDGAAPTPKAAIEVVNADGSGAHEVVQPDYFIKDLAWTPDGTQVVYFQGKGGTPPEDGDAYMVAVEGGTEPQLLFPRYRLAAWSPSGTQALWLSEPADDQGRADLALTSWPLAGEPQVVAEQVAMAGAAWAGSDGWLVYSQDGALYLAAANMDLSHQLTLEEETADAPVWLPGRGLAYRVDRDGYAVLRLLPLASSEAPTATLPSSPVPAASPTAVSTAMPPATPTPQSPPGSDLAIHASWSENGSGALEGQIVVTNQGQAVYTLQGVPVVEILDGNGQALPTVHGEWDNVTPDLTVDLIPLQPGRQASSHLVWANYCGAEPNRPLSLRVTLPDGRQLTVADLGEALPRCNVEGPASVLTVWPFVAGAGTVGLPEVPTPTPVPEPVRLSFLHMVDTTTGWATADSGILRTVDGGRTWQPLGIGGARAGSPGDGTFFLDAQHAWVAGVNSSEISILRTSDGGQTWQSTTVRTGGAMGVQFSFSDAAHGYMLVHLGVAAGSEGVAVLRTADGGQTWQTVTTALSMNGGEGRLPFGGLKSGIGALNAQTAWVSGFVPADGVVYLYVTHDGGQTWQAQSMPLPAGYESAQVSVEPPEFFSAQEGILLASAYVGSGNAVLVYRTTDGGATWTVSEPIPVTAGDPAAVRFADAQNGWVLAPLATDGATSRPLFRTRDGGRTWEQVSANSTLMKVTQLDMLDAQNGFALDNGYLLRTSDGGRTWAEP